MTELQWFKEAKYGLMVHFGLYSVLGGVYKGKKSGAYAEWIQATHAIPNSEMEKIARAFNPIYFDADEWAKFAVDCGIGYVDADVVVVGCAVCSPNDKTNVKTVSG